MSKAAAARLLVGGACVLSPGWVLAAVGAPDQHDRRVRLLARALGARMVVQGGLEARDRHEPALDVAVELAHAASMLPVAMIWPRHRRSAGVSAAVAVGIAMLDLADR